MEEELIEFVKNNQFLYDKRRKHYKNILLRNKKFDELSKKLNVPAKKLKDRWRTLRDRLCKELKNGNANSGSGFTIPKKKWKWMDHLAFLKDTMTANTNTSGNFLLNDVLDDDCGASSSPIFSEISKPSLIPAPGDSFLSDTSFTEAFVDNGRNIDDAIVEAKSEMAQLVVLAKGAFATPSPAKPKTATQFFFDGLAKQVDDANLPPHKLALIQIEVMKLMNKLLYEDK